MPSDGGGLDIALVLLVIAVMLILVWIVIGDGGGGGTWKVHQLRITAPENQIILGCNTGIISNVTTGTVTYNLPDPATTNCKFILSEATDTQNINSNVQLEGNLVLENSQNRSILHGSTSTTSPHTLLIQGSNTLASATGGSVTVHAGESATGQGGDVNIIAGKNGSVNISGGPTVFDDDIEFSTTKNHYIKFADTGATTRSLFVQGLDTTDAVTGGILSLSAGSNTSGGDGGALSLLAGKGGVTAGNGGAVTLAGGDAQAAAKNGGAVSIQGGKGGAGGTDGAISIGTSDVSTITLGNTTAGMTTIEGALQTTPSANLLVTGNAGPTFSILSTSSGHLRLAASHANTANYIESGATGTAASQRKLHFTGIAGTPIMWTMGSNAKGANLTGTDDTAATSSSDTSAAFHTAGGIAVAKNAYFGDSIFLKSGGTGLNWYQEATLTTKATFTPGGNQTTDAKDVKITRIGRQVNLYGQEFKATKGGTTNAGTLVFDTALDANFRPVNTSRTAVQVLLNGAAQAAAGIITVTTAGVITVYLTLAEGSFTDQAGNNGLQEGWSVTYSVT